MRIICIMFLMSGCVSAGSEYCDISNFLFFDSEESLNILVETDPRLVRDIVKHNSVRESVCAS